MNKYVYRFSYFVFLIAPPIALAFVYDAIAKHFGLSYWGPQYVFVIAAYAGWGWNADYVARTILGEPTK